MRIKDDFDPMEYRLRYMNLVAAVDLPVVALTTWAVPLASPSGEAGRSAGGASARRQSSAGTAEPEPAKDPETAADSEGTEDDF